MPPKKARCPDCNGKGYCEPVRLNKMTNNSCGRCWATGKFFTPEHSAYLKSVYRFNSFRRSFEDAQRNYDKVSAELKDAYTAMTGLPAPDDPMLIQTMCAQFGIPNKFHNW
jgi:hypothetical protein